MICVRLLLQRHDAGAYSLLALNCSSGFVKCESPPEPLFTQRVQPRFCCACVLLLADVQNCCGSGVRVAPGCSQGVSPGNLQQGCQLVWHRLQMGTVQERPCELEVSYLNYSTPVLLFSFPLDDVIEMKVVEGGLIYFINLILKILEFAVLVC